MNSDSSFRKKRRESAIEHLLDAAESVIARVGYDSVTMAEIAEAAGCATGTLYLYFRDKQQLVTALVERHGRRFRERIVKAMEETPDPLEKLRRAALSFLDYFSRNRNYFKVLYASNLFRRGVLPGSLPPGELEERKRFQSMTLEVIRQAQARGQIRSDFPPEEIAGFMRAYMVGMLDQLSLLETLPTAEALMRAIWAFMTGGMAAREA